MADFEARDMGSLKLTVDKKGVVWRLDGSCMPSSTKMDSESFINACPFDHDDDVRIVGIPGNASLIIEMYHQRLKKKIQSLEVCSPLCCLDPSDREDPEVMLYSMRKFNRPPCLGGWHEFDVVDLPSYLLSQYFTDLALAMDLKPAKRYPDNYVLDVLYHHPAWPYLSFIEGLQLDLAAELISIIIDPRWYTDVLPENDDGERLEQYLGLYPGVPKDNSSVRSRRYQTVLNCWKNSGGNMLKTDGPRGFIWRVWAAKGGGEKGDLAACKCLANYLRLTWTMSLCIGPQQHHLFVPGYFFANKDESDAFFEHINKFDHA